MHPTERVVCEKEQDVEIGNRKAGQRLLARLVRRRPNRALCIKLMHWNPRKDDLRPRHLLQPSTLESWGKHGHDGK